MYKISCVINKKSLVLYIWMDEFGEKQVYICQTNYKHFDKQFKKVENLFLKIAENLLT